MFIVVKCQWKEHGMWDIIHLIINNTLSIINWGNKEDDGQFLEFLRCNSKEKYPYKNGVLLKYLVDSIYSDKHFWYKRNE